MNEKEITDARAALQRAAKDAIQVQDACNFSGVEYTFHEACNAIREHMRTPAARSGSEVFAKHPIIYLFMSKLASLFGENIGEYYGYNSLLCEQIAVGDFHSVEEE